jgi:flagellar FliJ protein
VSKPFRFRLERVRELRAHAEDRAREDLAASLGAQLRGEAMLMAATHEVAQAQSDRRDGVLAGGPVSCIDLQANQLWVERLQRQRADAELALERASAEVDARRRALVEASRSREALERLKERRRLEHRAEMERVEGARLDEMALNGFLRRTRAEVVR